MHDEIFSDDFFASMDSSILDVNNARMLPPKCYSDPRFFEFEKDAVFGHDWLCVGREAWIPNPGDYFTSSHAEEPIIVVRTEKGEVKALSSVCQHRAMLVAEGRGNTRSFLCPYHHWSYALDGRLLGYAGHLSAEAVKQSDLRGTCIVAELRLAPLINRAELVPQYSPLPAFPAVSRDLNLVVDETVRWAQIAATVRAQGGAELEAVEFRDTYRDAERLGTGKKSLLFSIVLRGASGTLTSQQADAVRDRIVGACRTDYGAELRA